MSQLVGVFVEQGPLRQPFLRQRCTAHASVRLVRLQTNETIGFQRAQETARVARVEPQARTQVADGAAGLADLIEQPRLRERTTAAEIVGIKDADTLCNRAAEAADGVDVDVGSLFDVGQAFEICLILVT